MVNRRPLGRASVLAATSADGSGFITPFLAWGLLGEVMRVHGLLGSGSSSSRSSGGVGDMDTAAGETAAQLPHVSNCWSAAAALHAAARSAKATQCARRRTQQQQQRGQQQQQQQQQAPQQRSCANVAASSGVVVAPQQRSPQQPLNGMLMGGACYVARSWPVLLASLPRKDTPAGCTTSSSSSSAWHAAVVPAEILAAGRSRHASLQRAIQHGSLAWAARPPALRSDSCDTGTAAVTHAADAATAAPADGGCASAMDVDDVPDDPARHMTPCSSAASGAMARCLVRVAVRAVGRGRVRPGAALLLPLGDCYSQSAAAAAAAAPETVAGNGRALLLGYITAAVPRGAPAHLYPGGTGFCDASALWAARAAAPGPHDSRLLRGMLLNPGSSALVAVEVKVLLDCGDDGGW
jgi:hypothetical protein